MDKILKYLSIIVFIFAVICIAALPILYLMSTTSQNGPICHPNANGKTQCGATFYHLHDYLDNSIAKAYVKVMKEDRERQQKYLEDNKFRLMSISDQSFWEAKPAARLKGAKPDITTDIKVAEMAPIREWMYDKDHHSTSSFLRNGIRYRNGRLVVPVDGTYFLYSLIDFFEPCDHST